MSGIEDLSELITAQDIRLVGLVADEDLGDAFSRATGSLRVFEAKTERAGMAKAWRAVTGTDRIDIERDTRVRPYTQVVEAVRGLVEAARKMDTAREGMTKDLGRRSARTREKAEADFIAACDTATTNAKESARQIFDALRDLLGGNSHTRAEKDLADGFLAAAYSKKPDDDVPLDVTFDVPTATSALAEFLSPVPASYKELQENVSSFDEGWRDRMKRPHATTVAAGEALAEAVGAAAGEHGSEVLRYALAELLRRDAAAQPDEAAAAP